MQKAFNNLSLIAETEKENHSSVPNSGIANEQSSNPEHEARAKGWILESPPPEKNRRHEIPEQLLLTPIPGYKFVLKDEYERIMAQQNPRRVTENWEALHDQSINVEEDAINDKRSKTSVKKRSRSNSKSKSPMTDPRRSHLVSLNEKIWYAVPYHDEYERPSGKGQFMGPNGFNYSFITAERQTDLINSAVAEKEIGSKVPHTAVQDKYELADILGENYEQDTKDEFMRSVLCQNFGIRSLSDDLSLSDIFEDTVFCYMRTVFEMIMQKNQQVLTMISPEAMVQVFQGNFLGANEAENAQRVVQAWMDDGCYLAIDERFLVVIEHESICCSKYVVRFESFLTIKSPNSHDNYQLGTGRESSGSERDADVVKFQMRVILFQPNDGDKPLLKISQIKLKVQLQ